MTHAEPDLRNGLENASDSQACACCGGATEVRYRLSCLPDGTNDRRLGEIRWCGHCEYGFLDRRLMPGEREGLQALVASTKKSTSAVAAAPTLIDKVRLHLAWRIGRSRARLIDAEVINSLAGDRTASLCIIGCDPPELAADLVRMGHRVVAVDWREDFCRATDALGVNVARASIDLATEGLHAGAFDLVFLNQCLQSARDPRATLDRAGRLVRDGGRLVVEVPNHACHSARRYGPASACWNVGESINYFTRPSLSRMIAASGCEIEETVFRQVIPQFDRSRLALEQALWDGLFASRTASHHPPPPRRRTRADLWLDLPRIMRLGPDGMYEVMAIVGTRRSGARPEDRQT